ncbi:enoyl-CoA hydratase-related protein [Thermogemmatispora sp.]|uniref:enoyl-CoA hydratase-related protein n=1 Tax=Thermogemmatispora sp. TaxID=1968838 RepID=UPI0035E40517
MEYTLLSVERSFQDRVATLTMRRPEVHNAFNRQLIEELQAAFTALGDDERLQVVVLTGAGASFSAGADIQMMQQAVNVSREENVAEALRLADLFETVASFPCPVVARVNGTALGGGLGLIASCDLAIAVETARFAFSEVRLGIAPAVIAPYVVRKIGEGQARALFVTGEQFTAARARELGLVHVVVASQELDAAVEQALRNLLRGGPRALRACKQLATRVGSLTREEARAYTANLIADLRASAEGQEGLRAFLEKRKASWVVD